jgi:hypothetical protein
MLEVNAGPSLNNRETAEVRAPPSVAHEEQLGDLIIGTLSLLMFPFIGDVRRA